LTLSNLLSYFTHNKCLLCLPVFGRTVIFVMLPLSPCFSIAPGFLIPASASFQFFFQSPLLCASPFPPACSFHSLPSLADLLQLFGLASSPFFIPFYTFPSVPIPEGGSPELDRASSFFLHVLSASTYDVYTINAPAFPHLPTVSPRWISAP